jgi:DNA-binding response OmpR family regulator
MEHDGYWMKTDDFADKPIPADELVRRIEKLLSPAPADAKEG